MNTFFCIYIFLHLRFVNWILELFRVWYFVFFILLWYNNNSFHWLACSPQVDRGSYHLLGQTKAYKIGICHFSAKHAALRRKSKDWLARNQNNVSEWSDMSTRGPLYQWASTIKIQLSMLVENKEELIIISLQINLFSPWYRWKIAELVLSTNNSLTHSN